MPRCTRACWPPCRPRSTRPCTPFSPRSWRSSRRLSAAAKAQLLAVLEQVPLAYNKVNAIFADHGEEGAGRGRRLLDLRLGPLQGLRGVRHRVRRSRGPGDGAGDRGTERRSRDRHRLPGPPARHLAASTSASTTTSNPHDSKTAALRNHLMVRRNYEALVSGDGACAGCGEKSVLHAVASLTEASCVRSTTPRPSGWRRRPRACDAHGAERLAAAAGQDAEEHALLRRQAVAHLLMGLGGERRGGHPRPPRRARPDLTDAEIVGGHGRCAASRTPSTTRSCRRSTAGSRTACR